jgi:uncharacterized integral membrane protein
MAMDGSTLIFCGVVMIVAAIVGALVSIFIFSITGKKLKRTLEKDYGKLKE